MAQATAYAPGHLTGLFQVCLEGDDPLRWGARGAGVTIKQGVTTTVEVEPASHPSTRIYINDKAAPEAIVSRAVLERYQKYMAEPLRVTVRHRVETPMTAGFGSSGGGALSLSLALNQALGVGLSRVEAAHIAHLAELECKTGLGSVYAAYTGGFGVLLHPGAPGVGRGRLFEEVEDLRVVYVHYGPMETREALSNKELVEKVNRLGGVYVEELGRELTPKRFMEFSRRFTEHLDLAGPRVRRILDAMDEAGWTYTMACFGEVAFTLQYREEAEASAQALRGMGENPVVVGVEAEGARLVPLDHK